VDQDCIVHDFPSGQRLEIVQGDITVETTDAIVNAANRFLEHGSGVAGAILRRGGPTIQAESHEWVRQHGLVEHSEPAYTSAGNLRCRFVIHAVGPVWSEGNEEAKLTDAIRGSLRLADQLGLHSISFPAISTGIYGFPIPLAVQVILAAISSYLAVNPSSGLELIRLVLYDHDTWQAFADAMEQNDHLSS
jgi:O-acetyl-ADP-ribose deacetylase (regulator of RNase III)